MTRKQNGEFKDLNDVTFLEQTAKGLEYLHNRDIIHCNIRPENILISEPMKPKGDRKAMITDYNISADLASDRIKQTLLRSDGWLACEVLRATNNDDAIVPEKSMDIFALGCLFYYVLTRGEHPFGDRFLRHYNILHGKCDMNKLMVG